ncbi:MAG: cytochrome P450 [Paenibacillus lautus]|jgi:cytochrome P450|uniref:cytochrome P450 n=1 Tax=Paenibacillus lautus TaxID=1401 RepID=UPI0026F071E4|nr:cytochrome P450 [Paenibacillus lautus]MCI1776723.1 cytochrome P450 [Paenibacillus lautus]
MEWNKNGLLPLEWFRQMRTESPVAAIDGGGAWNVFKYEDVKAVFTNYEVFSSQGSSSSDDPIESSVLRQDPPKHRQLRKLVSHAFTPRMIESLAPKIQEITTSLLDEAEKKGKMDIVADLASPLPITVIAEMLGVSMEYRERFKAWSDALVGDNPDAYYQCQREMSEYFSEIAEDRRRHPQDDLITKLVEARIDNEHLTELEIIGFCILLLVAGNETTTNLISSAVLAFDSLPEVRAEVLGDSALLPGAIEEVFRYFSPVQLMFRSVKQDTVLRGQELKQGQFVYIWMASANHDEDVFDQPDVFNIHRNPNPHLGLGSGIHYCMGSQLARMESRIALQTLLDRYPEYRRDRSAELARMDSTMMFALKELPIILK